MARHKKTTDEKYSQTFATNLRALMETDPKTSQATLADGIGKSRQTISQYCNGESEPPFDTLVKIAKYFGVTTDWLLGASNDPAPKPSAVDTLGLSPAVIDGIMRVKQESQELIAHSKKVGLYDEPGTDPLSGLNIFLESTLGSALYDQVYWLKKEVEHEAHATPCDLELAHKDFYCKCGKTLGDSHVQHELVDILIEKHPELEGRIEVRFSSFKLSDRLDGIIKLLRRCLTQMSGYSKLVK